MDKDESLTIQELLALARMGLELGYLAQAAGYYERILEIEPRHPEALLGKAKTCQDVQEALRLLDLLLEVAPDSSEGQRLREELQRRVGPTDSGAPSQEEAPTPSPTPPVILAETSARPRLRFSGFLAILALVAAFVAIVMIVISLWPRSSAPFEAEVIATPTALPPPTVTLPDPFAAAYRATVLILVPEEWGTGVQRGSGVVIDKAGFVLTDYHVLVNPLGTPLNVDGLAAVGFASDVRYPPDTWYIAGLAAYDEQRDLAVLRLLATSEGEPIQGMTFPSLPLRDASDLVLGEPLAGLGYPTIGGKTLTLTQGTMAGFYTREAIRFGKTDSELLAGSSGGAMIDAQGHLVGIISAAAVENQTQGRLSYFILINEAFDLLEKARRARPPSPPLDWIREWMALNLTEE